MRKASTMAMHRGVAVTTVMLLVLVLGNGAMAASPEEECLAAHNKVRGAVDVAPLEWSEKLAAYALQYAEEQRDHHECAMVHSRGPYGENLFWGSGKPFTLAHAVRSWADEGRDYDYDSNSCEPGKVCGHYTQVVWADTKLVGCAAVTCHDGATFVICSYDPPGNFVGERPYERSGAKPSQQHRHHHHHTTQQQDRDLDLNVPIKDAAGHDDDGRGGEVFDAAEAKLCQCMLSCVAKSQSSHGSTSK